MTKGDFTKMGEAEIVAENARQWKSINTLAAEVKVYSEIAANHAVDAARFNLPST